MASRHAPSARERKLLRAAVADLGEWDAGTAGGVDDLATAAATRLAELTAAEPAVLYRPARQAKGWTLGFWGDVGVDPAFRSDFARHIAEASDGLFLYDPLRPHPRDRNVARHMLPEELLAVPATARVFKRHGLDQLAQTRLLLCDGPLLMGWVGFFQPPHEALRLRGAWALEGLATVLRKRLRLARGWARDMGPSSLDAALEALPDEAFLVDATGRVETANAAGAESLQTRGADVLAEIADSVKPHVGAPFELHPIRSRGAPAFFLAVRRRPLDVAPRVHAAIRRWGLSPQQASVVTQVALGAANKEMAEQLRISVRTAEAHVQAILRKAGLASRARLIAEIWRGQ